MFMGEFNMQRNDGAHEVPLGAVGACRKMP